MGKLSFDETLEALGDGRQLDRGEVLAAALRRVVWVAEWHFPGCLSESFDISTTKGGAVASALMFAETGEGYPRGMKSALIRGGRFDGVAYGAPCITTIYRARLEDLF